MEISPILTRVPAAATGGAHFEGHKTLEAFSSALTEAMTSLDQLQHEADAGSLVAASNALPELHQGWIAQQRSSFSFELAVQVQSKLVEAYQDIMRMQI